MKLISVFVVVDDSVDVVKLSDSMMAHAPKSALLVEKRIHPGDSLLPLARKVCDAADVLARVPRGTNQLKL